MKHLFMRTAIASVVLFSGIVAAQTTTPSMTPAEAKAQWDSLTPAQQAAFKAKAMNEAQSKQSAWNALTPEQQAAKKAAAKEQGQAAATSKQDAWNSLTPEEQAAKKASAQEKAQPYMDQAKAGMASHMGGGMASGGGMHRRH